MQKQHLQSKSWIQIPRLTISKYFFGGKWVHISLLQLRLTHCLTIPSQSFLVLRICTTCPKTVQEACGGLVLSSLHNEFPSPLQYAEDPAKIAEGILAAGPLPLLISTGNNFMKKIKAGINNQETWAYCLEVKMSTEDYNEWPKALPSIGLLRVDHWVSISGLFKYAFEWN